MMRPQFNLLAVGLVHILRRIKPCLSESVCLLIFLFASSALRAGGGSHWTLQRSTISYRVSHPLHAAMGVSRVTQGEGVCQEGHCDFLISAPIRSFNSYDPSRDQSMFHATREAQFPKVTVRTRVPEEALSSPMVQADLEIEFAGQTAEYKQVAFQLSTQANEAHLSGTIPVKLSDFKIDPPTLMSIPVKNDMPVGVDMTWREEQ